MPVGKLTEIKNATNAITVKNVINDYGKQLLPQATADVISVFADNLTDQMVMGNKSSINEYAKQLEAQGMSAGEAAQNAITEFYGKHLLTALGNAAFQAGVFTGGAEIYKGIHKPNMIRPASPSIKMPEMSKENPQLTESDDSAAASNTPILEKSNKERFSDIYYEKKAEDLLKAYKEYLKTNPIDQNETEGYNNGAGETAVIGESMNRVMPYAEKIGAEVYAGFKYYDKTKAMFGEKLANFIGGVDNALWLIDKMVHKYKIVDLGLDVERAIHSPYYLMESVLSYLYKYKEYAEDFMKGVF